MGPTSLVRALQIHPTRQCNLSCLHCYSSSSPKERGGLDATLLCHAIDDAVAAGFNTLSLSGGEPLLYEPVWDLLQHAKERRMRTTLTTNGMLLNERRLAKAKPTVDVMAISLDGIPESHNANRNASNAFQKMYARLPAVREAGIPFGFIFTLTQHNLNELQWVADFAVAQGAVLLQIHSLEQTGQASTRLVDETPDARESAYAWFIAKQLQQRYADTLKVQIDIAFSDTVKADPESVFAGPMPADSAVTFADLVAPLIIEADATVSPLQYQFPRDFSLGNLHRASLHDLMAAWRDRRVSEFYALCRDLHDEICAKPSHFFNWYELITKKAKNLSSRCTSESLQQAVV